MFHLSILEAADQLGVCRTSLKKASRRLGIGRWPGRKIASVANLVGRVEQFVQERGSCPEADIGLANLRCTRGWCAWGGRGWCA